jgi:tetratricopeptide (TPR) repeat protein
LKLGSNPAGNRVAGAGMPMAALFRNRRIAKMAQHSRARGVLALLALLALAAAPACNKLRARDLLNKGVEAYKVGHYDASVEFFKEAKELDPTLLNARLYLATAYASQYIPGAPSEENTRRGQQAIEEYKEILQINPNSLQAIDGIGWMLFQMAANPYDPKKLEEAKEYYQKHIEIKPSDPEPYYWVGVIDWTIAFRHNKELRNQYNEKARKPLKEDDPLPASLRNEFVNQYGPFVDEGVKDLQQAIILRPDYADAMAYLNLLYRQKADMAASSDKRAQLLQQADALVDKVREIKQKEMTAPQGKS